MIFYFSGTKNSLTLAKRIAEAEHQELLSISEALHENKLEFQLQTNEILGFVVPTYFYGIPTIVLEFLQKCHFMGSPAYTFLVLTCGNTTANAAQMFCDAFLPHKIPLQARFVARMIDTYLPLFTIPEGEKLARAHEKINATLDHIVQQVAARSQGDFDDAKGFLPSLQTKLLYSFYQRGRKTQKFTVSDACIACGLCERQCPVKAITIKNSKPVWRIPQCVQCFACLHSCPKEAIDYGAATKGKKRYLCNL